MGRSRGSAHRPRRLATGESFSLSLGDLADALDQLSKTATAETRQRDALKRSPDVRRPSGYAWLAEARGATLQRATDKRGDGRALEGWPVGSRGGSARRAHAARAAPPAAEAPPGAATHRREVTPGEGRRRGERGPGLWRRARAGASAAGAGDRRASFRRPGAAAPELAASQAAPARLAARRWTGGSTVPP